MDLIKLTPSYDSKLIFLKKSDYKVRDSFELTINLEGPGSLNIFYIKPEDKVTLFFPNPTKNENSVSDSEMQLVSNQTGVTGNIEIEKVGKYLFIAIFDILKEDILYDKIYKEKSSEPYKKIDQTEIEGLLTKIKNNPNIKISYIKITVNK